MLTKVRLEGVMGKEFGKDWEFDISSPAEALRMIEANRPGLRKWVIENREVYDSYRVVCVYDEGEEELDDDTFLAVRGNLKEVRFVPVITGAGGVAKIVVGVLLIAASFIPGMQALAPYMWKIGAALILGGIVEALSPRPTKTSNSGEDLNSYYFDGPVNTETQGAAVPVIYGRVLVGSHPISASISISEVPAS